MRSILTTLLIVGLVSTASSTTNPDGPASIYLGVFGTTGPNEFETQGISQDGDGSAIGFNADLRLPVSPTATLSIGLAYEGGRNTYDENTFFFKSVNKGSRISGSMGIRFYFGSD